MSAGDLRLDEVTIRDVQPVSFTVPAGTCVGLCGPSGIGKSSLLRAVADMEPHGGRLFLGETESQTLSASQWRRRVGLLPSESMWWSDEVRAHFLCPDKVRPEVLGLRPDVLSWPVKRLSSGERQRLALLRLLDREPEALLLDEPTANLDGTSTERVETVIRDYAREHGAPVIWVGHSVAQLRRVSHRVLAFDNTGALHGQGEAVAP